MNQTSNPSAEDLKIYTLKNVEGTQLQILNLGASVFSLFIKDKNGKPLNVVVGPKNTEDYISEKYAEENRCFGASVGRYAGRISNGSFQLKGKTFELYQKNGAHLHGGFRGFQHKIWKLEAENSGTDPSLIFSCISEDGEEGYPGRLEIEVKYTLKSKNEIIIEYKASTNKSSPVNLTNHTYFNLSGKGSVSDHQLCIKAWNILEVDEKLMPTGKLLPLEEHPKNFSYVKEIEQLEVDDTFVLNNNTRIAASLYSPETGIEMQVETNQPSVVVYIPKQLPRIWQYQTEISDAFPSVCMETQNFPDAPNHDNFPKSILEPGEKYLNRSVFKFRIRD
ncbi:aldose epimerase family protein [Gillisia limnaea]|uniref:Aldose 1-epimerase n=1 Tax=Gillisia limnaea (strain DSM 15749 / LMG 21470 / R-8282) TaxID=865937 RepID=H2BRP7_GILLR|nr:aldose epimerase family protein [Gillisia limnaea]EHQ01362.1 aldose 1-epimerase [Gillisia limnaea DSM 15749]